MDDYSQFTFEELDRKSGIPPLPPAKDGEFPLPAWYRSCYRVPFGELTEGDLARACRQEIHLDQIVPVSMQRIRENPLAGEMWEGELIHALIRLPGAFWESFPALMDEVKKIARPLVGYFPERDIETITNLLK